MSSGEVKPFIGRNIALGYAEMLVTTGTAISPRQKHQLEELVGELTPEEKQRLDAAARVQEARQEQAREEAEIISRALRPLAERIGG